MDQKQFDELVEKVGKEAAEKIKANFAEFEKKSVTLDSLKTEVDKILKDHKPELDAKSLQFGEKSLGEYLASLEDAARKQGDEITAIKNAAVKNTKAVSFSDQVHENLKKNEDALKSMGSMNTGNKINFSVKTAGTMLTTNTTPEITNAAPYILTSVEGGIENIVQRQPFLRQLMNSRPTNAKYVAWAEKANKDGAAGVTAEGQTKNQIDFDIIEATAKVEKVTAFIKTSKENLADIQEMRNAIDAELIEEINLAFDVQLLSGNGTSPQLKGLLEYCQAFNAGALAGTVQQANVFDVLRVAAWQVANSHFSANYFLINPIDAAVMDLTKTTYGTYVLPPFMDANGRRVAGMIGVENTGVTAGDFVVGDFTKSNLRMREELNITVGLDGNDFTKNLVTILGELRAAHFVKANHANAFVTGTFSTAITSIGLT